jgi:mono/diheme cytochrome c family protein
MRPTLLAFCLLAAGTSAVLAQQATQGSQPPVPFTEEFLHDAANIDAGAAIWQEQCRHCHGAKAYPGKAPKLRPSRYEPEFVYRRVTDGFRKMPPWKDVYTDEERMQITAYVLSDSFSP